MKTKLLKPLLNATPERGAKLFKLKELMLKGFNIPETYFVSLDILIHEDKQSQLDVRENLITEIQTQLESWMQSGHTALAIRSSSNLEDGDEYSGAGQLESATNISSSDDIRSSLNRVLVRMTENNEFSVSNQTTDISQSSIFIQPMLQPLCSGVLFTVNPLTGKDTEMVNQWKHGQNIAITSGLEEGNIIHWDWYQKIVTKGEIPSESQDQFDKLFSTCLKIQKMYGKPQDIEWAIEENQITILQTRPITFIQNESEYDWTNANMRDGGVSSSVANPLVSSMYRMLINDSMPQYFERMGMNSSRSGQYTHVRFSHLYWNLSFAEAAVLSIPGVTKQEFYEGIGIVDESKKQDVRKISLFEVPRALKILWRLKRSIAKRHRISDQLDKNCQQLFARLKKTHLDKMSLNELADFFQKTIEVDWKMVEGGYFDHIYDNSNCRNLFLKKIRSHGIEDSYLEMISGLGDVSHIRIQQKINRIVSEIQAKNISISYYLGNSLEELVDNWKQRRDFPEASLISDFLKTEGFHSTREIDLMVPSWSEDPSYVFSQIQSLLKLQVESSSKSQVGRDHFLFNIKTFPRKIQRKLSQHRDMMRQREELRIHSVQMFHWIRQFLLQIGKRLAEKKFIEDQDDVFMLDYLELCDLIRGQQVKSLRNKIEKNWDYYLSFQNLNVPNEIWRSLKGSKPVSGEEINESTLDKLVGVGCSAGLVEGEVSVVENIANIHKLKPNTILVTKSVDPAWSLSLGQIKGLVTETGGVLSHGAVICRERRVPAILAVENVCAKLKTGERISLNGRSGQIEILNSNSESVI